MKLWQKENTSISEKIEKFTIGRDAEMDLQLAKYDVIGSIAHTYMLEKVGLLEKTDLEKLIPELNNLRATESMACFFPICAASVTAWQIVTKPEYFLSNSGFLCPCSKLRKTGTPCRWASCIARRI